MDILVTPTTPGRGLARWLNGEFPCSLGRNGVSRIKREGDGCTPVGAFALRRVLWRADRLAAPRCVLPVAPIARDDGWCDAPDDPLYNRPVTHPYPASAERLAREDGLYDVIVVLGHNDAPVVAGAGSAIFMHVSPSDDGPTAGCIALPLPVLLQVLERCGPTSRVVVTG